MSVDLYSVYCILYTVHSIIRSIRCIVSCILYMILSATNHRNIFVRDLSHVACKFKKYQLELSQRNGSYNPELFERFQHLQLIHLLFGQRYLKIWARFIIIIQKALFFISNFAILQFFLSITSKIPLCFESGVLQQ